MSIQQAVEPDIAIAADTSAAVTEKSVGDISQGRLMVRRFKQSKLAIISLVILAFIALLAIFAPFFSPNPDANVDVDHKFAKPSSWTWNGGPALCAATTTIDTTNFTNVTKSDCSKAVGVSWFGEGYHYKLLGLIPSNRHLIVSTDPKTKLFLWGADSNGADVFARAIHGGRISLSIGVITAGIVMILGGLIGTLSGYMGGAGDTLIQRIIELIQSIPPLPLWASLSAVMPSDWSVSKRFFVLSIILAMIGWPGLARAIRGKVLSYARSDYVSAAKAAGSGGFRILRTHLFPNAMSHIVAATMLAIPAAILGETTLSFLGLGMQKPGISWGVMLLDAQDLGTLTLRPWLLIPAALVVVAVACFQFVGDGVRDAVDPYG